MRVVAVAVRTVTVTVHTGVNLNKVVPMRVLPVMSLSSERSSVSTLTRTRALYACFSTGVCLLRFTRMPHLHAQTNLTGLLGNCKCSIHYNFRTHSFLARNARVCNTGFYAVPARAH